MCKYFVLDLPDWDHDSSMSELMDFIPTEIPDSDFDSDATIEYVSNVLAKLNCDLFDDEFCIKTRRIMNEIHGALLEHKR